MIHFLPLFVTLYMCITSSFAQVLNHDFYTIQENDTLETILKNNSDTINRLHLTKKMYLLELKNWNQEIHNWQDLSPFVGTKIAINYNHSPFIMGGEPVPLKSSDSLISEKNLSKKKQWKIRPQLGIYNMQYNKAFNNKPFEFDLKNHFIVGMEVINSSLTNKNIEFDAHFRKLDDVGIYHFKPEWAAGIKIYNKKFDRFSISYLLEYEYALNFSLKNNLAMTNYQNIVWVGPGALFNLWSGSYFSKGQIKLYYTAFSRGEGDNPKGYRGDLLISILTYNNFLFDGYFSLRKLEDSVAYSRSSQGINLNYSF